MRNKQHSTPAPLEAATRALARKPHLTLRIAPEPATGRLATSQQVVIGGLEANNNTRELRGEADLAALALRFHDPKLHGTLRPQSAKPAAIFDALERTRVELLGSRQWQGVQANLTKRIDQFYRAQGFAGMPKEADPPVAELLASILRSRTLGTAMPQAIKHLASFWQQRLEQHTGKQMEELSGTITDQKRFAELVNEIIHTLESGSKADNAQEEEGEYQATPPEESNQEEDRQEQEGANPEQHVGSPQESIQDPASMAAIQSDEEPPEGATEITDETAPSRQNYNTPDFSALNRTASYTPFTTRFDEVIEADKLTTPEEITRLRNLLDQKLQNLQSVTSRLSSRLQRALLAQQTVAWEYGVDEGLLDNKRIARRLADPTFDNIFKRTKETEFRSTVVTLLLDNSGSMRGRPITIAAICADILARTLERCGVKVEILGFTTRDWKGGQSHKYWVEQNRPANPGRLNDLRHIIYKSADTRWQKARRNLGLMLKDGILKENIDGEGIVWAHQRLLARTEQRRILMVISDGAPVDDSTLSANGSNYLDQHLREVISTIENYSPVELLAIGIGHDVTRYYKRAVTISDVEQLGNVMAQELVKLFKGK